MLYGKSIVFSCQCSAYTEWLFLRGTVNGFFVELLGLFGVFPSLLVAEQAAGTALPPMIHREQAEADPALPGLSGCDANFGFSLGGFGDGHQLWLGLVQHEEVGKGKMQNPILLLLQRGNPGLREGSWNRNGLGWKGP